MSVPNSVFLSPDGERTVSTRSNPRSRTPMRHASPLLVTGRLFDNEMGRGEVVISGERRRDSIPEETGEFGF